MEFDSFIIGPDSREISWARKGTIEEKTNSKDCYKDNMIRECGDRN